MTCQVEGFIGHWIRLIYRGMTNAHDQKLMKYGLTVSQFGVLVNLWRSNGLTQKELQERLEIRPATLTGIIDGLVLKGWVRRECDSDDARFKRLYITEAGLELKKDCTETIYEMEKMLTKDFTEDEINILLSLLKRVHDNIE